MKTKKKKGRRRCSSDKSKKATATAAEQAADRNTFTGDASEFYKHVLKPTAEKGGRTIVAYSDESKLVTDAKILPKEIMLNNDFLDHEHKLQDNFCIPRSVVTKGLQKLLEKKGGWGMTDRQQSDFVTTLERRICNLNYVVNQVQKRKDKPKWWYTLGFVEEENTTKSAPSKSSLDFAPIKVEAENGDYKIGFSTEHQLAWRHPTNQKK